MLCLFQQYVNAQVLRVDSIALGKAYADLQEQPKSVERQKAFIEAFPAEWIALCNTYALDPKRGADANFNNRMPEHMNVWSAQLTEVDDSTYCCRLIDLSVGATVRTGALAWTLQLILHDVIMDSSRGDVMLRFITTLADPDQVLFWQFFWSASPNVNVGMESLSIIINRMIRLEYYDEALIAVDAFRHTRPS